MLRIQHFSHHAIGRMACIVASVLLVGFFLAACGSNTTTGSGGSTPTPTQPAKAVNCGQIQTRVNQIPPAQKAAAQQAANCFYQAYQKCQPATLTFSSFGVDTGDIHNLSVKSANGYCTVSDGFQHFIAPKPPSGTVTYSCASMSMQSDGLHVESCGTVGTFVIPTT
jgi:predicted small secreted protein